MKTLILATLLLFSVTAHAAEEATTQLDSTIHRHKGFFLRFDIGAEAMTNDAISRYDAGPKPAVVAGFMLGGAVAENFIIAAHIYGSTSISSTSLGLNGLGPSFTYYFMPLNIYISTTLAAIATTEDGSNLKIGYGGRLALGKEWWISDHWGMGLALHGSASATPTVTVSVGLGLSITYN